ncbi:MAG: hypothetical protein ACRDPW_03320, partial [Mycobacteriales bacterium]
DTQSVVSGFVDADNAAQAPRPWVPVFFTVLVLLHLGLLTAASFFFHRRRQAVVEAQERAQPTARQDTVDPVGRDGYIEDTAGADTVDTVGVDITQAQSPVDETKVPVPATERRGKHLVELAALTLAGLPVATFLAALLPWWRAPLAFGVHLTCIVAVTAVIAVVAQRGPWRRWPLGPATFVATFTAMVLAADVITGSAMQLNSLAGYSPLVAGRFTGFGNLSFAIFAAALLLSAAYLGQCLIGWRRVTLMAGMGTAAVIVVGVPSWGSDVGGVIALTPAVLALVLRGAGVRLTTVRAVGCGAAGLLVVAIFAALDYARPPADRTHLGRFVAQLFDGSAGVVIRRKAEANLNLLFNSKLTVLVLAVAAFVIFIAWRRGAGLRRLLGIYPCLRAGMLAVLFAAAFGFVANDSGIAVPAFMAVLAVPLVIATALRVLRT